MSGWTKVLVIGLDCAPPELIFDQYLDDLPTFRRLMDEGAFTPLESCMPAITVPAWSSMLSSKDPGTLGFYGFRNRADYSYKEAKIANGASVKEDRVWDVLSRNGKRCVVVGVPQTYPPRPLNGQMVSCFLTPGLQSEYTYPAEFKREVEQIVPDYMFDVANFRTENKDELLRQIHDMTERRFTLVKHLLVNKPWDFFMFVEMGTDRIHHGFWKFIDPQHHKYEQGNRFEHAVRDYYKYIDGQLAEILNLVDEDTVVMVVSDHGAKRMDGGICFNEWLIREGYLTLNSYPETLTNFEKLDVDWSRTKAWGSGGYYGRLFFNVRGREPHGIVPPEEYEALRDELVAKLEALGDEDGQPIGTQVFRPEQVYRTVKNIAPDLIVYFGDLYWRSVGTVGHRAIHTFENDTGPDDANHAQFGIAILRDPRHPDAHHLGAHQLMDVAPTILELLGVPVPADMQGRPMRLAAEPVTV